MLRPQELVDCIESLPSLPAATTRLASLIHDPTAGAPQFVEVIKPDIGLTTSILRLCNSAFFGLSREITSIQQAITLLGSERIFELAMSSSMAEMLRDVIAGYQMEARTFWLHSVAVGVLVDRFSDRLPIVKPDLAFISGLLHDVGKLAIGLYLEDHAGELLDRVKNHRTSLIGAERELLGTDHAEIGAQLAACWRMPEAIYWSAMWHHSPTIAPSTANSTLIDLVHLADCVACRLGLDFGQDGVVREIDGNVLRRMSVRENQLTRIAGESMPEIVDLSRMLIATG